MTFISTDIQRVTNATASHISRFKPPEAMSLPISLPGLDLIKYWFMTRGSTVPALC